MRESTPPAVDVVRAPIDRVFEAARDVELSDVTETEHPFEYPSAAVLDTALVRSLLLKISKSVHEKLPRIIGTFIDGDLELDVFDVSTLLRFERCRLNWPAFTRLSI